MNHNLIITLFCSFTCLMFSQQEEPDAIALAEDQFQDSFYESLKQKGIENYDKAILSLQKCMEIDSLQPDVYYELGKNYFKRREFELSEKNYKKATELNPDNKWYWSGWLDVLLQTRQYADAEVVLNKLIAMDVHYQDELVSVYMYTHQYQNALDLINEMNDFLGKSERRTQIKSQILSMSAFKVNEKEPLLENIQKNPKEEVHYISLMNLYLQKGEVDEAFKVAQQLAEAIPNSEWSQVSLFKFYLDENNPIEAIKSMHKVLASSGIDHQIKHRIFNEFLIFTFKNPNFHPELEAATRYFLNDKEVFVMNEMAKFFHQKNDIQWASYYYEIASNQRPDHLETYLLWYPLLMTQNKVSLLAKSVTEALDLFPLQPELYFYAAWAQNQQNNFNQAIEFLETGLDYILDSPTLEIQFYQQIVLSYEGLGDVVKKNKFLEKVKSLQTQ